MKKPLLWVLVLVMSVSLIMMFSSGGCRPAVSPVEEPVIEEPALVDEPAEESMIEESLISTPIISPHPWPMRYHDAQRTSRSSFIGPAELPTLRWVFEIDSPYGGASQPVVAADNTIYLSIRHTNGGDLLYAVKPDGSLRWTFKIPEEGFISMYENTPCIGTDGTIYVASKSGKDIDSTLYALNPDGTVKWKYNTEKHDIFGVLFGSKDTIFVITSLVDEYERSYYPGELLIISSDGMLIDSIIPPRQDMLDSWSIGADGTLYGGHARLYAWSADGVVKWMYDVGKDIYTDPVIGDDGTIYVIIDESRLHALNPDGTLKWTTIPLGIGRKLPAIGPDGTVYVVSSRDGALYALNSEDGTPKWIYERIIFDHPIVDAEGTIYVSGLRLYAINPDGTLKWSYDGKGATSSPVIGTDGTIYSAWNLDLNPELYAISD